MEIHTKWNAGLECQANFIDFDPLIALESRGVRLKAGAALKADCRGHFQILSRPLNKAKTLDMYPSPQGNNFQTCVAFIRMKS